MTTWREAREAETAEENARRKLPGQFACPSCDVRFELERVGSFPEAWELGVAHDHSGTYPIWRAVLYQHAKGQRYPLTAKQLLAMVKDQKRQMKAERKLGESTVTKEVY